MEAIAASDYNIYFNDDCYAWLYENIRPENYSLAIIIADSNTANFCLPALLPQFETAVPIEIIELEPGEENKNIDTCIQVWETLAELGADRKSIIINLGGGMVTDLGGFIAATFKRGIDFINIPTSLLAMVDASFGGKTGIDLGSLKNQVGLIANPVAVLIDTAYLATLPPEHIRCGFAEMFKHGLICDSEYWKTLVELTKQDNANLDEAVNQSVEIKNNIVLQDPTEKGLRKILNFGHTLGHAIESYYLENPEKPVLLHGDAVAAGMVLEAYISYAAGGLDEAAYRNIKETLLGIFERLSFTDKDIDAIIKLTAHDKKNEYGQVKLIFLEETGKAEIGNMVGNDLIYNAFRDYQY